MGKRKKRSTPSPPESSDEVEYSVEVITAARKSEGKWEYLVKWYTFGDHENTWEPTDNFNDCERLLNSFWAEVGEYKREKAREGIEIFPRQQWIDKEKKLYLEIRKAEEKAAREGHAGNSDEDSVPLRKLVGNPEKVIDSSDDDEPLSVSLRRPGTFKETGLLKSNKSIGAVSNKMPKRTAGTDVTSRKKKSLPIADKGPPTAPANRAKPRPSKPTANNSTSKSPTHVSGFSINTQTSSLPSLRQPTNQATGNDNRGPKRTQLLPSSSIMSSSSLSTKARIATDMAKGPLSFSQPKPRYQGLTMRKNTTLPGEARSPVTPSTANPQSPLDSPQHTLLPRSSNELNNQMQMKAASLPQRSPPPPQLEGLSLDPKPDRMDIGQHVPPSPPRPENLTAAEDLLHTIIPEQNFEQMSKVPDKPTVRTTLRTSELSRRDTNWSGTLFNSISEVDAERLCDVTIQDHTAARGNMKLELFLQKSDSIRLRKFYDLTDLDLLLPSFNQVTQLASLVPSEEKDKEAFAAIQEYLLLKEKFTYCTLSFINEVQAEKDAAAYMFITPMSKLAFALLGAPNHTENKDALLVALALLAVPTKKYQEEMAIFKPSEEVKNRLHTPPDPEDTVSLSAYHLARRILDVPKHLITFLSSTPRPCIIWPQQSKANDVWISEDTKYLRFILNRHRAPVYGPKDRVSPRIVFVHVGRMKDIHTMPRIARFRGAPLDLQFHTYGTHPTVPTREWGIRGFNISGGIMTFTTNALLNDPDGVGGLIERVARHEHWACYVTPVVLGAAVRWAKELEYPALAAAISGQMGKRISEGKIACMIAPPTNSHLSRHAKDCDTWVEFHSMQSELDPQEIVDDCEDMYQDAYHDVAKRDRDGLVLSDLQRDLVKMSNQPAIKYEFRRFVIIKSPEDVHGRPGEEDWCEWKLASEFKFEDEGET